jgi:hypothetical protein
MVLIYTLSDQNGNIRYVGKTNQYLKQRLYSHIKECKTNRKSHKISWLKSILKKGYRPKIEILDQVDDNDWQFWEQYWISQLKYWGFNLTNLTEGGQGGNGYKHSEESREKMRKSKLGIKLSEEHKLNISEAVKQKAEENSFYNRAGNNLKQPIDKDLLYQLYIVDNLSMPKISEKLGCSEKKVFDNLKDYGIKKDKRVWKKQCVSNPRKIVLQYDLDGNLIKEWNSLKSVSKFYQNTNIASCCRGESVSASGFIWRYKDEFIDIDLDRLNYQKRKVSQYDLQGNLIRSFDSIKEASLNGFNEGNIQDCCVGRLKSSKGFIWRYSGDSPPEKYKSKTIKSVLQFTLSGEFIKEWDSISIASKDLKIGGNSIVTCCKGKYKSAGGYIWKYKDNI